MGIDGDGCGDVPDSEAVAGRCRNLLDGFRRLVRAAEAARHIGHEWREVAHRSGRTEAALPAHVGVPRRVRLRRVGLDRADERADRCEVKVVQVRVLGHRSLLGWRANPIIWLMENITRTYDCGGRYGVSAEGAQGGRGRCCGEHDDEKRRAAPDEDRRDPEGGDAGVGGEVLAAAKRLHQDQRGKQWNGDQVERRTGVAADLASTGEQWSDGLEGVGDGA